MATYTLTTNGDNLIGTAGNDTFNATYDAAVTDTFGANDFLNGGIGIDTLHLDHLQNVAITPPDTLWTNLRNIENVVSNTTGDGAQTITTGVNFQAAFAPLGVGLTTRTSGTGAIDITMTTFTGAATLGTTSTAGAQNIVTGSGATTVAAISGAGALNIKGVGLKTVTATTTGAGAQTIGDGSGNGGQLAVVRATSAGGAQTITSTSTSAVVVEATSAAGKQIITTGSGADIITASTTSATNTIDPGAGNDTVTILPTTSGSYTVNGDAGNDTITGGAGNDILVGGLGNDILNGGAGVDNMTGGDGSDVYYIDIATDVVTETNALASPGGIDTVNSSLAAYTLGANLENLTLTGTAAINGTGNVLNNAIIGNSANNILSGFDGNDILNGSTGADTMIGGVGNDIYYVENAGDITTEALNEGTDTVSASLTWTLANNLDNLTLTGTAANGTGNSLNNTITGNTANNSLTGGAGNDVLLGGSGNDSLTGGGGSDRFVYDSNAAFTTAAVGVDTITDFISGADKFILDKTTFTAIASVAGTGFSVASELAVVGSDSAATTSSADIIYNSANGKLFYNTDGAASGFGTGGQFAVISGLPTISASDFIIQA